MGERKGHSAQQIDLRDSYHSDSDPDGRQVKSRRAIRLDPVHCHPNHLIHVSTLHFLHLQINVRISIKTKEIQCIHAVTECLQSLIN